LWGDASVCEKLHRCALLRIQFKREALQNLTERRLNNLPFGKIDPDGGGPVVLEDIAVAIKLGDSLPFGISLRNEQWELLPIGTLLRNRLNR